MLLCCAEHFFIFWQWIFFYQLNSPTKLIQLKNIFLDALVSVGLDVFQAYLNINWYDKLIRNLYFLNKQTNYMFSFQNFAWLVINYLKNYLKLEIWKIQLTDFLLMLVANVARETVCFWKFYSYFLHLKCHLMDQQHASLRPCTYLEFSELV